LIEIKLIEVTSPFAYSVAFRMLGDEDQAKDVVQETMITIWQKLKKIKSPEVYKTWVYRISEEPSAALENKETSRIISILTERLSPKQKADERAA